MFKHIRIERANAVRAVIKQLRLHETSQHWGW